MRHRYLPATFREPTGAALHELVTTREHRWLEAIANGDHEVTWHKVGEVWWCKPVRVDGLAVCVSYQTALESAALMGARLPTLEEGIELGRALPHVDPIKVTFPAGHALAYQTSASDEAIQMHSDALLEHPEGLLFNDGKLWIGGAPEPWAWNFGWADPGAPNTLAPGMRGWQPLGSRHKRGHVDCSQTLRLVRDTEPALVVHDEPDTAPSPGPFDSRALDATLGERCLHWLGHEWGQPGGVVEIAGTQSNMRIVEYSKGCRRGGAFLGLRGDESPRWDGGVPLTLPNDASHWCATTQSAAMRAALRPGEVPPHGLRVSVRELWEDAERAGTTEPPEYDPVPGDLQILARWVTRDGQRVLADPTRGSNGHVRRFVRPTQTGRGLFFGGNESTDRAPQGELNYREREIHQGLDRARYPNIAPVVGWIVYDRPARLRRGIDVSHHQDPHRIDYDAVAVEHRFVVARASYGVARDRHFSEHIRLARAAGLQVGAYHFFRQHQSTASQMSALLEQLEAAMIRDGDIVPAVDLEYNESGKDGPVDAARHNSEGRELVELLSSKFGACLVYLSPAHYAAIERPLWVHEHPTWIAHHGVATPAWNGDWAIWQDRVEPGFGYARLDYNWARQKLHTIG
jgi:GH25 family lysozyme M1 (1,4-beta-N-acetylmuramidase)